MYNTLYLPRRVNKRFLYKRLFAPCLPPRRGEPSRAEPGQARRGGRCGPGGDPGLTRRREAETGAAEHRERFGTATGSERVRRRGRRGLRVAAAALSARAGVAAGSDPGSGTRLAAPCGSEGRPGDRSAVTPRCRPRRSPIFLLVSPAVPPRFRSAASPQRDGSDCGRGSAARPQPRRARGFLITASRSSRAPVPRSPTAGEAAKPAFFQKAATARRVFPGDRQDPALPWPRSRDGSSAAALSRSPGGCGSGKPLSGLPGPAAAQGSSGPGSHAGRGIEKKFP